MRKVIYFFTGTGNSLVVARDIAEIIGASLVPIPSLIHQEEITSDAETIGIVYPVYNQGVSFIIKRFVDLMNDLNSKYIFAVCTHGGSSGISLEYLDKMLHEKNGSLAAGFSVRMPYNYVIPSLKLKNFFRSFVLKEINPKKQQELFNNWRLKLADICRVVQSRQKRKLEVKSQAKEHLIDFLNLRETLQKSAWLKIGGFKGKTNLPFQESLQLLDHGFTSDHKCQGCGICAKICPVENIEMVSGRPVWQHHCEQCFACLQWCPNASIQFGYATSTGKRYHHPDVKLSDMYWQKTGLK